MDLNPPKKDVHKAYIGFALLKMGFTSKKNDLHPNKFDLHPKT